MNLATPNRLIFYRHYQQTLDALRVLHGARDLARRLPQPPGVPGDRTELASGSDEPHRRKEGSDAARITGEQG